jgi:hypothetical protein
VKNSENERLVFDKLSVQNRDLVNRFLFLIIRICVRPLLDPQISSALEADISDLQYIDCFPEGFPSFKTSDLKPQINPMKIDLLLECLYIFWGCSFEEVRCPFFPLFSELNIIFLMIGTLWVDIS